MEQVVMGGEGFAIIGAIQGKSRHGYNRVCRIMWTHLLRAAWRMGKTPWGMSACLPFIPKITHSLQLGDYLSFSSLAWR